MAKWTKWRRLAKADDFFDEKFDNDGASCYELGIKTKEGTKKIPVYVGHTDDENRRMRSYGSGNSHLEKRHIDRLLKKGFVLYYRSQSKNTKLQAEKMEKKLLKLRYYAWNVKLS